MLRRALIATAVAALAVAAPPPSTARAVPVPLQACVAGVAAPGAPCLPVREAEVTPLEAAARSGAAVVRKVLSTASFGLF